MNKKIYVIFLILIAFVLSGCTANYELNIDSNLSLNEELTIDIGKTEFKNIAINNMTITDKSVVESVDCSNLTLEACKEAIFELEPLDILSEQTSSYLYTNYFFNDVYDMVNFNQEKNNRYNETSNSYQVKYGTEERVSTTSDMLLNKLVSYYSINNQNNVLTININNLKVVDKENIDQYNIKISAPYEVISSNASNISRTNGNMTATWNFTNANSINISLQLDTSKTIVQKEHEEQKAKNKKIITTILIILVPTVLIVALVLSRKLRGKDKL